MFYYNSFIVIINSDLELSGIKIKEAITASFIENIHILANYIKQNACCNCRTDNAGNIRAHSVHKEEVARIFLLANSLCHTSSHRNGRYTGRTDKLINIAACCPLHNLTKEYAECSTKTECSKTKADDKYCIKCKEVLT